jgi:hypothetical protein
MPMATLTLSPSTVPRRTQHVKPSRSRAIRQRKAALRASGHSYTDLMRLAAVTHSMAWKWMNGERVSQRCARAFAILTGGTVPKPRERREDQ